MTRAQLFRALIVLTIFGVCTIIAAYVTEAPVSTNTSENSLISSTSTRSLATTRSHCENFRPSDWLNSSGILPCGVMGYWPMNEARSGVCTGSVFDLSGNNNTGACTGSPFYVKGSDQMSGALNFSRGSSSYVNILEPKISNNSYYVLSVWVNFNSTANLSSRADYRLVADWGSCADSHTCGISMDWDNGKLRWEISNGAGKYYGLTVSQSNLSLSTKTWYNFIGEVNSSGMFLFVNGVLAISSSSTTRVMILESQNLAFGQYFGSTCFCSEDDVMIIAD